ncbi:MAG: imidazole glycerol phosphate synthase subunit HisF [Nannocystaceae bacterium]
MLTVRIIPCLDVRGGRVVKGVKFQGLTDAGSPAELAARYEQQGADEIVMLDVSATPDERRTAFDTVRAIRGRLGIPLTVGGGVRTVEDAADLLEAGADKVSVNTAAVRDPSLVDALARRFGSQCTVVAIDAVRTETGSVEVVVASGVERVGTDAIEWATEVARRGAGEILFTSWDRDGTREGYDCEMLARVSDAVPIPVIASGGANSAEHLLQAFRAGASAALAASIFHYSETTVGAVKDYLARQGIEVRT